MVSTKECAALCQEALASYDTLGYTPAQKITAFAAFQQTMLELDFPCSGISCESYINLAVQVIDPDITATEPKS